MIDNSAINGAFHSIRTNRFSNKALTYILMWISAIIRLVEKCYCFMIPLISNTLYNIPSTINNKYLQLFYNLSYFLI